jgi:hypothetical protein
MGADHLLNASEEYSDDILNDYGLLCPHHLLNNFSGKMQGRRALGIRFGTGCRSRGWRILGRSLAYGLDPAFKIDLLEVGTVPPVPLGALRGVPLSLARVSTAGLLPVAEPWVR